MQLISDANSHWYFVGLTVHVESELNLRWAVNVGQSTTWQNVVQFRRRDGGFVIIILTKPVFL